MTTINLGYFKKILEKEKESLLNQLRKLARKSSKSNDWQPRPPETSNIQAAEDSERAAVITKMEADLEIEKTLEGSLDEVNTALLKIEDGTYGLCEKTGDVISEERLKANPTAKTCMNHF